MNAQQLRNSILQEAIEGRLVKQDPNDEPASALLERIREEKKRLVKEGKLKKKDLEETPISEDEKPFDIPESWEWCKLGNILKLKSGDCIKISSLSEDSKYPVYGGNGINGSYDYYNVEAETLIVGRVGFYCGSVHKTNSRAWVTDNALIVTYNKSLFHIDYMKYALIYLNLSSTSNSTAQPVVSGKGIYPLLIPLPPLAEQKRIVAKIEELLPKVEEYGKAQEALDKLNEELPERLKKSVLQEAISGKLVPQDPNDEPASVLLNRIREEKKQLIKAGKLKKKDLEETPIPEDEKPFEIPGSWEWVRVNSILNVYSARRVHQKDWRNQGIPFYRAREIGKLADHGFVENDLYIEESLYEEFSKSGVPQPGDLMITAVGTLGKVYIVKDDDTFYYKDGSVLCMNNLFRLESKYLKYYVESPIFKGQYEPESQGTTVATLTMVRVNEYLIPLPPLAEQRRIVAKIEEAFKAIDALS